ncbi:thiol:disulfide interchange protein [Asaia sp. W19]|uniref:thioredoxin domain-containing protein n=1 Tax=unclassified Asaia TaxID=2685023 RepID=UPI000F8D7BF3|nr:thioredoxin domain-containing protein [Asaia sp. W19]RUT24532.1 thiol:disulfide interchange protein [Asaia sp. W19]
MSLYRRSFLAALPALALIPKARAEDSRLTPRTLGNPKAPVTVNEWFSLTCTHCAHFEMTVFQDVKTKLIDTGKVFYVYHDFPLDQIALLGAMVARSLPVDRYVPFVNSMLASQDRWAFARDVNPKKQIQQMAALAGISADQFAKIDADDAFRQALVAQQDSDQAKYNIGGTPFFMFNNQPYNQELLTFEAFEAEVKKAGG